MLIVGGHSASQPIAASSRIIPGIGGYDRSSVTSRAFEKSPNNDSPSPTSLRIPLRTAGLRSVTESWILFWRSNRKELFI